MAGRARHMLAAGVLLLAVAAAPVYGAASASDGVHLRVAREPVGPLSIVTLYDQNNNDAGVSIPSQSYPPLIAGGDAQAADDFLVPAGHVWKITGIDVTGRYDPTISMPASHETVTFWTSVNKKPAAVFLTRTVKGADNGGSFTINVKNPFTLSGGTTLPSRYWLTVAAHMHEGFENWEWETRSVRSYLAAYWQNPGGTLGTTCPTWTHPAACFQHSGAGPDFMFSLIGRDTTP